MAGYTSRRASVLAPALAAVAVLALTIFLLVDDAPSFREDLEQSAYEQCTDQVRDQLKAPSTAVFPTIDEAEIDPTEESQALSVHGYVDSENGFSAMVRSDWLCAAFVDVDEQRVSKALVLLIE